MRLIQCHLSTGQRMPLLVQDGVATPLPVLVPFLYVQLKLKYRAYNTAAAHLRAIQAFYIYAESRSLNVDEAILACRFESILAVLDGYVVWLLSGRRADNISARIGAADSSLFPQIDLRTRDQYLRLLKRYLAWAATRYLPRTSASTGTHHLINAAFVDVAEAIERRFENHIVQVRPPTGSLPQSDGGAARDHPCPDLPRWCG
nr:hypothetical protein [Pseudomonas aeruginosa]